MYNHLVTKKQGADVSLCLHHDDLHEDIRQAIKIMRRCVELASDSTSPEAITTMSAGLIYTAVQDPSLYLDVLTKLLLSLGADPEEGAVFSLLVSALADDLESEGIMAAESAFPLLIDLAETVRTYRVLISVDAPEAVIGSSEDLIERKMTSLFHG